MIAALVGACAVTDPVDNRYDHIGRSLAKGRNESIFLNIVRAAHDYPLAFTTIGSVTPSMTNTSSLALPSFLLGPSPRNVEPSFTPGRDVLFGNTTASSSLAISSNFNISTEETSAFYNGFLKPIDLATLEYFVRQGYSRELLFWMFMDSFQISYAGRAAGFQFNPPYDFGCPPAEPKHRCFREFIQIATITGLSVQTKVAADSGGGGGGASKGGGSDKGSNDKSSNDKSSGSSNKGKVYARFCFDKVLAARAIGQMKQVDPARFDFVWSLIDKSYALSPHCTDPWDPAASASAQTDTLTFQVGPAQFTIQPRSAYSMFQFLGTLIKFQQGVLPPPVDNPPFLPRPLETELPILSTVPDDPRLFTVTVNQEISGECFSHTWFADGNYCIPEGAANTKRIFSMLAQLIAIETSATDLSITPTVRIIQ
jgi:hypothetical protein